MSLICGFFFWQCVYCDTTKAKRREERGEGKKGCGDEKKKKLSPGPFIGHLGLVMKRSWWEGFIYGV